MADSTIVNYIRAQQQKGIVKDAIVAELETTGWSDEQINEGFSQTQRDTPNISSKSSNELLSFERLISNSWHVLKHMWKRFLVLYLLMFLVVYLPIILGVGGVFLSIIIAGGWFVNYAVGLMVLIILAEVYVGTWVGIVIVEAIRSRSNPKPIRTLIRDSRLKIGSFLLVNLATGVLISVGLLFFIIPGIILLICYVFATYEVIYNNRQGAAALAMSRAYSKGRQMKIFIRLILPGLLIMILSFVFDQIKQIAGADSSTVVLVVLVFRVALEVIIAPFSVIYSVLLYEDVRNTYKGNTIDSVSSGMRSWFYVLVSLGGLIIAGIVALFVYTYMNIKLPLFDSQTSDNYSSSEPLINPGKMLSDAYDTGRKNDTEMLHYALEMYYLDNLTYPEDLTSLVNMYYVYEIPMDPKTDMPYVYEHYASTNTYVLCATLEHNNQQICYTPEGEMK